MCACLLPLRLSVGTLQCVRIHDMSLGWWVVEEAQVECPSLMAGCWEHKDRQTDRQTDTRQQQTVGHMEQSYAGTEHMGILPVSDTNH